MGPGTGDIQDNCTWGRVKNSFQEMHEGWGILPEKRVDSAVVIGCSEVHAQRQRQALETQVRMETHLRRLQNQSGIQPSAITRRRNPAVNRIAVEAHLKVKAAWSSSRREEKTSWTQRRCPNPRGSSCRRT